MTERLLGFDDALELVAVLERRCRQLRAVGDDDAQAIVADIEQMLAEIREDLGGHSDVAN